MIHMKKSYTKMGDWHYNLDDSEAILENSSYYYCVEGMLKNLDCFLLLKI